MLCAEHEIFFEAVPQRSNVKFNRHCANLSAVSHVNFTLLCLVVTFGMLDVFFIILTAFWINVSHRVPFFSREGAFSNF